MMREQDIIAGLIKIDAVQRVKKTDLITHGITEESIDQIGVNAVRIAAAAIAQPLAHQAVQQLNVYADDAGENVDIHGVVYIVSRELLEKLGLIPTFTSPVQLTVRGEAEPQPLKHTPVNERVLGDGLLKQLEKFPPTTTIDLNAEP